MDEENYQENRREFSIIKLKEVKELFLKLNDIRIDMDTHISHNSSSFEPDMCDFPSLEALFDHYEKQLLDPEASDYGLTVEYHTDNDIWFLLRSKCSDEEIIEFIIDQVGNYISKDLAKIIGRFVF